MRQSRFRLRKKNRVNFYPSKSNFYRLVSVNELWRVSLKNVPINKKLWNKICCIHALFFFEYILHFAYICFICICVSICICWCNNCLPLYLIFPISVCLLLCKKCLWLCVFGTTLIFWSLQTLIFLLMIKSIWFL